MLSATAVRAGQPLSSTRRAGGRATRGAVQTHALFGFLAPAKAKASPNKAQELVSELLELSARTDGGLNASPARREQIAELVEELETYCPRNPLRSPLLYGDYEVLYASKPQTAGGPFRSPLGRAIFPGQRAVQSLQEPNVCINEISYKALGFVPGASRQEGEFTPISSDTFQLVFPELDGKAKGGPPQRIIQIAYLDERVRVARAIPAEDAEGAEPSFYVFQRIVEEEEAAEEEEEEVEEAPRRGPLAFGTRKIKAAAQQEQEEAAPARPSMLGTQLLRRRDGLATIAEKRYAQQQGGSRGTGPTRAGTTSTATVRKTREEVAAERAAAKAAADEERRAAREAAAAAKAAAEEERRARQAQLEEERARAAQLKEAAREQLAQLQSEAAEAADKAKTAVAAAKDAEKAAGSLLQEAGQARSIIEQAASAAAAAVQRVEGLKQQEKEAAGAAAEARNTVKQLQAAGRRR